jgi:hypothetical protein
MDLGGSFFQPGEHRVKWLRTRARRIAYRFNVIQIHDRQPDACDHGAARNGDNVAIFGVKRRLAHGVSKYLELGMPLALVTLDQHEVAGRELP